MKINLDDIKKEEFHKIPDGYFEDLPLRIRNRIESQSPAERQLSFYWKWAIPVAASILITALFWLYPENPGLSSKNLSLSDISETELIYYMDQQGYSTEEIVSMAVLPTEVDQVLTESTELEEYMIEEELLEDFDWFHNLDSNSIENI